LSILERTGVSVEEREALRLFQDVGASVDCDTSRVRISRSLVEDAVDWVVLAEKVIRPSDGPRRARNRTS
jgi:trimethylamine:corrinoid methyltransferase-like protein